MNYTFKIFLGINLGSLFVLLEGPDDENFFLSVLKPYFDSMYSSIKTYQYVGRDSRQRDAFLRTLMSANKDFIALVDQDDLSICNTSRKSKFKNKYFSNFPDSKIFLVKFEIESWYLAGISNSTANSIRIRYHSTTNDITKERFNELIPQSFTSRIDFMNELLKYYDFETAKQQNNSFQYFVSKMNI